MSWREAFEKLSMDEKQAVKKLWRLQKQIVRQRARNRRGKKRCLLESV
jgi:hypothetical protein